MTEEQAREAAFSKAFDAGCKIYTGNFFGSNTDEKTRAMLETVWDAATEYANRWTYLPELPQKDGWFAVTINDGDGFPDLVEPFWWNGSQWTDGDNIGDSTIRNEQTVVAWRELPEPADIR